ncbi:MAG: MOSC domain-containing protein [Roseiflexaceae bacterium]|nr:MOSC domain-containing protein [Roseiflexaceae bacterium]
MAEQLQGRVVRINVNPAGGVPKYAVDSTELTSAGVKGDKQRDKRYHGGPNRAVCLFSAERIAALQAEGHPIEAGSTGENLTIAGIDWDTVQIGDAFQIGERAVIEITEYTTPCAIIAKSFVDGAFKRMLQKLHPGWSRLYARVLIEGAVREGDAVVWTAAGG